MTEWRLIVHGPREARLNMAIDEAVLDLASEQRGPPTLRFFDWERPAITVGYHVDAAAELDVARARAEGIPVVRRITGGGAVLHGTDLTYSIVCPRRSLTCQTSVVESYRAINRVFVQALRSLGVAATLLDAQGAARGKAGPNVCFMKPTVYDVLVDGRKLIGNAQRRRRGWVLNHGSMLLWPEEERLRRMVRAAASAPPEQRGVSLVEATGGTVDREAVIDAVAGAFGQTLGVTVRRGAVSGEQAAEAQTLVRARYSRAEWSFGTC